jgi:hypothetical protein
VQTPGSSLESAVKRIAFLSIAPNIAAKTVFRPQAGVFCPHRHPKIAVRVVFYPVTLGCSPHMQEFVTFQPVAGMITLVEWSGRKTVPKLSSRKPFPQFNRVSRR